MLNRWNFLKTGFYEGINYDADVLLNVFGTVREDSQVHPFTHTSDVDGKLHCNILTGVPIFINETSCHTLPNIFLWCPWAQPVSNHTSKTSIGNEADLGGSVWGFHHSILGCRVFDGPIRAA